MFVASVSFVAFVSFVLPPQAAAQMATAPGAAGYKQETGMVSSALPAPLRAIGFDQNIDQHVPLDTVFRDESGAAVRLGDQRDRRGTGVAQSIDETRFGVGREGARVDVEDRGAVARLLGTDRERHRGLVAPGRRNDTRIEPW